MDEATFAGISSSRNHSSAEGTVAPEELLAFVARTDFDCIVAERHGSPEEFAQAANLDGTYRFEETVAGESTGTVLDSPAAVVTAFADWALDRSGWRNDHVLD